MKRTLPFLALMLALSVHVYCPAALAGQGSGPKACQDYSDTFDTYDLGKWQDVLLYSKARGTVVVENGQLTLKTPKDEACEIQVHSLFCFEGDFDIQADYLFSDPEKLPPCRFNAGLVMQTLGDEQSYKCYVSAAQKEDFLFRARLDEFGENNLEKYRSHPATQAGVIRIIRKDGHISFQTREAEQWNTLYTFSRPCKDKLRVRFKLQTSGEDGGLQPCPVTVKFDNFKVNACDRIVEE